VTTRKALRILLADDHGVLLEGLKALVQGVGHQVVGQARDGREAVRLATQHQPDVVLLDVAMPVLDGFMAARQILRRVPGVGIVFLTGLDDNGVGEDARAAGGRGLVTKTHPPDDVLSAIEAVSQGREYGMPAAATARRRGLLTPRERQVLRLIALGRSTKEVAVVLGVSVKTADSHRTRLMKKLDIHGTAGLVRYAMQAGLVTPEKLR
jgi:DNA-binding NarL/FixJ family response regulator